MWVQETCNDASFPSEAAACFFNASIEVTRASISEFFAAKASAMSDSILVAALLDTDKSSCSCFIRASYELLRSLWKGGRWTSKYYNIVPTSDYFYKWRHWSTQGSMQGNMRTHFTSETSSTSSCEFSDLYSWRRDERPAQTWTLIRQNNRVITRHEMPKNQGENITPLKLIK